jgi:hypothetical protein
MQAPIPLSPAPALLTERVTQPEDRTYCISYLTCERLEPEPGLGCYSYMNYIAIGLAVATQC